MIKIFFKERIESNISYYILLLSNGHIMINHVLARMLLKVHLISCQITHL